MFTTAARNNGYHPFPRPSANASRAYTNPDGAKFGACQYCGYCQRFGCEANAKGSPHMTVIPIAMRNSNFELRTHSWVTKVLKDTSSARPGDDDYTELLAAGEKAQGPAEADPAKLTEARRRAVDPLWFLRQPAGTTPPSCRIAASARKTAPIPSSSV